MGATTGRRLSINEAIMADPYRPTSDWREGYEAGFRAGYDRGVLAGFETKDPSRRAASKRGNPHPKRKPSAWNKFVKANSKKPRFKYRNGKLNLKKMAVAFRKTPAGKKKRR